MLFLILTIVGSATIISIVGYSLHYGISPMPSSKKCCRVIVSLAEGKVAELGSGWGGLSLQIKKKGCDIEAFEISPLPNWVSRLRGLPAKRKDFFEEDLSSFDTIVCYLYPGAMKKLKIKFERELKPGTLIITNTFAIPGWRAAKVFVIDDLYRTKVISYSYALDE